MRLDHRGRGQPQPQRRDHPRPGDADPRQHEDEQVEADLRPQRPVDDIDVRDVGQRVEHRHVRAVLHRRDLELAVAERDRDDRGDGDGYPVRRVEPDHPRDDELVRPPSPGAQQHDEAADREEHVDAEVAVPGDGADRRERDRDVVTGEAGERVVVEDDGQCRGDPQQVDLVEAVAPGRAARPLPPGPLPPGPVSPGLAGSVGSSPGCGSSEL